MFVAPTSVAILILPVVPSLQSSLRKLRNAEVWHVVVNVFEDCSDGHICQSSWIELQASSSSYRGIHMVLNILDSYPYKLAAVNFLSLPMSNSTLYQICPRSASHLLDSRNDLSTVLDFARPTHPLTHNY